MKRILFIMLSALIMTACGSSNSDKEQARRMLAAEAIATNNQLQGMQIDFATKSDGCEFKDDIFHYYYTVYEEYVTIEALEACKEERKEEIIGFLESSEETKEMTRLMRSINGKFIFHYTGSESGKCSDIIIEF